MDEDEEDRAGFNDQPPEDEMQEFIVQDEEEGAEARADEEVSRRHRNNDLDAIHNYDLSEDAIEDFQAAFGDGTDYDFALEKEREAARARAVNADGTAKNIEVKDVFEPEQLAEKMLTDADNTIRGRDRPERFQVARAPYILLELTDEQEKEEAVWISNLMQPKRQVPEDLNQPFLKAIEMVLRFMNKEHLEIPYIFQHRKDYIIHATMRAVTPDPDHPGDPEFQPHAEKLLMQSDLWEIFELDLKFRALIQKRNALQRTFDSLQTASSFEDRIFADMLPQAVTMEELQDVQDYLYFQYPSRLADAAAVNGANGKSQKRPGATRAQFDRIRNSKVYSLVRAYGILPDDFAQNALKLEDRRHYTEDPGESPERMAASEHVLDPPAFSTPSKCLEAARAFFAEEIVMSPRMRKVLRQAFYSEGVIDCIRTDQGMKKIDNQHPFYEFKYLRNQPIAEFAQQPGLFLRMLKAEEERLVDVKVRLRDLTRFRQSLYQDIVSDNFSEVAEAWNRERRAAVDIALRKLNEIMAKNLKENLKAQCESEIALNCRERFAGRLDQAAYKPKGHELGTVPRVLTLSLGQGSLGRDPVYWAYMEDDGRAVENGQAKEISLGDPERGTSDGADLLEIVNACRRRKPDVIGVSGSTADARKLVGLMRDVVARKDIRGSNYEDDDGHDASDLLEVLLVNDEVARLYQNSDRAKREYPKLAATTRYCVALGRYLQNPLTEYASLGGDVTSLTFDASQKYLSKERILKALETAMIDYVNLVGVEINVAVNDLATANLLPYVCGLGPRKAAQLLKVINRTGGSVESRAELVGDPTENRPSAMGPCVWNNCASFLYIEYDHTEPESDYLDGTRVHPEDYDLGRKMAADALELDEEDIAAEQAQAGQGAVVRKLVKDEQQEKVNDLILEEYAEQLERNFNQRKRATLESIRAELQQPYEELRRNFETELATTEVFTMLTGETVDTLREGITVPFTIRRVTDDSVEGRLDCGVECIVGAFDLAESMPASARNMFAPHQTLPARIKTLNRKKLHAELSLIPREVQAPSAAVFDPTQHYGRDEWDAKQEADDKRRMDRETAIATAGPGGVAAGGPRVARVIKHPHFRPLDAKNAEEYLGPLAPGDAVVRPSSHGPDHLCVTWKVATRVYQHIDVLELDKESEFSLGRTLAIAGRWKYSDLDELLVNHVQAMARKVDEMVHHEKYKSGTKAETGTFCFPILLPPLSFFLLPPSLPRPGPLTAGPAEEWLKTYTEANSMRSNYAFCLNPHQGGSFHLCFKTSRAAPLQTWPVRVIPEAFELGGAAYPNMRQLCNGFKITFINLSTAAAAR